MAITSRETVIHISFTSPNCSVMELSLIHMEGLWASTLSILRIRKVFASTQMCSSIRPFSLRLGTMRNTYSGIRPKFFKLAIAILTHWAELFPNQFCEPVPVGPVELFGRSPDFKMADDYVRPEGLTYTV